MGETTMNWNHARAMLMCGFVRSGEVDGVRILTDGHMCCVAPPDLPGKDYPNLKEVESLWRDCLSLPRTGELSIAADCEGQGQEVCREIGGAWVAERYVRCFPEGVTWTTGDGAKAKNAERMRLAWLDDNLLGVVMPMSGPPLSREAWKPTDEEVYSPYSCEKNGWYLMSDDLLDSRLGTAENDVRRWEEKVSEAEGELEAARSLMENLAGMQAERRKMPTTTEPR